MGITSHLLKLSIDFHEKETAERFLRRYCVEYTENPAKCRFSPHPIWRKIYKYKFLKGGMFIPSQTDTDATIAHLNASMFYWRLLERYAPGTGFGHDQIFKNFLEDLGEYTIVSDFLPALYKYELNNLRFIKFIWLLFVPTGYDFMNSSRFGDYPFPINAPTKFCPETLSAWKIKCILDLIEEFSDSKYYDDNNHHRNKCLEIYMHLAFALIPYIEQIKEESAKDKLLKRTASFLSQNFSFEKAAKDCDSKKEIKAAVRFLLFSENITNETKLFFLEEIIEKNISDILSAKGLWSQQKCWTVEPIFVYSEIIDEILREETNLPYDKRIFSHQVSFVMEKARQYYGSGGYFSEDIFGKVFSLLNEEESKKFAEFILEVSNGATVITTQNQKEQMLLLIEKIPPEKDSLAYKAKRKIRVFVAREKEIMEKNNRRNTLIKAMCQ